MYLQNQQQMFLYRKLQHHNYIQRFSLLRKLSRTHNSLQKDIFNSHTIFRRSVYFLALPLEGFESSAASRKLKSAAFFTGLGATATGAATGAAAATGALATAVVGSNCPGKHVAKLVVGCLFSTCNRASVLVLDILIGCWHWVQFAIVASTLILFGRRPWASPNVYHRKNAKQPYSRLSIVLELTNSGSTVRRLLSVLLHLVTFRHS